MASYRHLLPAFHEPQDRARRAYLRHIQGRGHLRPCAAMRRSGHAISFIPAAASLICIPIGSVTLIVADYLTSVAVHRAKLGSVGDVCKGSFSTEPAGPACHLMSAF